MSEDESQTLSGVPETLLIPLYVRAMESQRPDAMLKDEKAVALLTHKSFDFSGIRRIPMNEALNVMRILQAREMDRYARDFLSRHPEVVVVHIGCGLDSRFERVDDGRVEWYDMDLPEIIELRRRFIGGGKGRHHLLGCSVFEDAWREAVRVHRRRPFLFLAEGVLVYFDEAQVKPLVLSLLDRFPGSEMVFDVFSPFGVWEFNLAVSRSKLSARARWGIRHSREIEAWGAPPAPLKAGGIRLLDEWGIFDRPEPRLAPYRWMAPIYRLLKPVRILHFRLGTAAE
jgi:O-methyltransferase involved in polyketide biosynthesis